MVKKTGIILVCCLLVAAGGFGVYYTVAKKNAVPASAAPSQIAVSTSKPSLGDIALTSEFIGTVEPDQQVQVFPKVSGTVLKTYFEVGQEVQEGDLLYEIDPTDLKLQYDAAAAKIEASKIEAEQSLGSGYDTKLITAKAQLDAAQTALNSARTNLRNANDNMDDGLLSLEKEIEKLRADIAAADENDPKLAEMEATLSMLEANRRDMEEDDDPSLRSLRTMYKNAQISYNAAKDAYEQAAGISREDTGKTVEAGLHAAEIGLEAQARQLEYTKVYAPISGVIEQKNVAEHGLSGSSQPAYTVSNKNLMLVNFSVSQTVVGNLAVGDRIQVENGGKTAEGTITEIPTMTDPKNGLFTIKATVDSGEIPLYTGATVKIYADTEKASGSILLPTDAVYYDAEKPYVYVCRDGRAVKTEIVTGVSDMKNTAVVSGITADDDVIVTWHPRLLDGAQVTLKTASSGTSSSVTAQAASSAAES